MNSCLVEWISLPFVQHTRAHIRTIRRLFGGHSRSETTYWLFLSQSETTSRNQHYMGTLRNTNHFVNDDTPTCWWAVQMTVSTYGPIDRQSTSGRVSDSINLNENVDSQWNDNQTNNQCLYCTWMRVLTASETMSSSTQTVLKLPGLLTSITWPSSNSVISLKHQDTRYQDNNSCQSPCFIQTKQQFQRNWVSK